ncbi:hypothetical protein GEMRC1_007486 [Eukaryota sp. GEM-RC1]
MVLLTIPRQFPLNDLESTLFSLFSDVVRHFRLHTVVRVAGGWVRDKVLNRPTKFDIDLTLSDMKGVEFAHKINDFLALQGKEGCRIAVIEQNPEKSKHLETARIRINDCWIDLCNLRSETYTAGSRIPQIVMGTPEDDALRRDFTINCLFYNIHTDHVEDFTGRSFTDISRGIVSTPLDVYTTLTDDPLRILRAIRFAARLRFKLDDSLREGCRNEQVHLSLSDVVSRERIGTETLEMFESDQVFTAINLFFELNLLGVVFFTKEFKHIYRKHFEDNQQGLVLKRCWLLTQFMTKFQIPMTKLNRKYIFTAGLLLNITDEVAFIKKKQIPLTVYLCLEALKWAKVYPKLFFEFVQLVTISFPSPIALHFPLEKTLE